MDKKIIFLFLILFCGFATANSLTNVTIRSVVPLNESLTILGQYNATDKNSGVLCSFFIFDTQTTEKYLVKRLSDEYTFSGGLFSSTEYKITEPQFQRGFDYNVMVCCNTACFDQNFYVDQTDEIAFGKTPGSLIMDLAFWNNKENSFTVFLIFVMVLIVVGALLFFVKKSFN